MTDAGLLVGTVDYLAPELIEGRATEASADQYALACLLYECLTGTPPFRRPTEAATLWAHMQDVPPPLPAGCADLAPPSTGRLRSRPRIDIPAAEPSSRMSAPDCRRMTSRHRAVRRPVS